MAEDELLGLNDIFSNAL